MISVYLLLDFKQAGCLLSQCLERLKETGQNRCFFTRVGLRKKQWQNGGWARRDDSAGCYAIARTCRSWVERSRKKRG